MKKILISVAILTNLFSVEKSDEITKLSNGIKSLLSQEMIAVEKSMKNIFTDIISGDYESLAKEATGIENSFILKRNLTKDQKKELHDKVSNKFISIDKSFHETAGKLASAADLEDKKEINIYFNQMLNTCVQCHATFATHRFSNFE